MSEMVERVAKAMYVYRIGESEDFLGCWEGLATDQHEIYRSLARAAMKELLVPTVAMIRAGNRDDEDFNRAGIDEAKTVEIYQAMVKAALR